MEDRKETFHYTYCAQQQEEVRNIRRKYAPSEDDKMEQLRRLDRSAAQKGTAASLAAGMVGALLLGVGMCCCMVWGGILFVPGVLVGVTGIGLVCCAYPLYVRITEKERRLIAPEILRLTDELMR